MRETKGRIDQSGKQIGKNDSTPYFAQGQRLKKARKDAGKSQAEISKDLSINERWLRELESGRKMPTHDLQIKIFQTLSYDPYGNVGIIGAAYIERIESSGSPGEQDKDSTNSPKTMEVEAAQGTTSDEEAIPILEPAVSSKNPLAIMCLNCGDNEHVEREKCRCGAYLRGQVQNQYSEWEVTEQPLIRDEIKRLGRRSDVFWVLLIVSYLGFLGLSRWQVTQEFMVTHFKITYGLTLIVVAGSGSIYFAMMRKKARLAKKEKNLNFDDFLKSSHFKTLRRWD